jgi:hypothetical protein
MLTVAIRGPLAAKMRQLAETTGMSLAKLLGDMVLAYEGEVDDGYEGSRRVALRSLRVALFAGEYGYVPAPKASRDLPPAVTAEEAICDLPPITLHLEGRLKRGARRFDERIPYPMDREPSPYAALMRDWPGFKSDDGVWDHVIRSLPRARCPETHRRCAEEMRTHSARGWWSMEDAIRPCRQGCTRRSKALAARRRVPEAVRTPVFTSDKRLPC